MSLENDLSEAGPATRAGFVALVGRPNSGKSTLLNALMGEKLSIVSPRAQTTRERVMGILTENDAQIVFVDTPGLLDPEYLLHKSMMDAALGAIAESDGVLLLLDGARPKDAVPVGVALDAVRKRRAVLTVALNKIDEAESGALADLERWSIETLDMMPLRISATRGDGLDVVKTRLLDTLPPSPFLYDSDDIAVQSVRFFVAEFVRESIFELYEEEIPYASVVRVEEFREAEDPVYMRITVYTERDTQKAIIIGKRGAAIKQLGAVSREKIEKFLGQRVYLDLWVKTLPGWRKKSSALEYLGYHVPRSVT